MILLLVGPGSFGECHWVLAALKDLMLKLCLPLAEDKTERAWLNVLYFLGLKPMLDKKYVACEQKKWRGIRSFKKNFVAVGR